MANSETRYLFLDVSPGCGVFQQYTVGRRRLFENQDRMVFAVWACIDGKAFQYRLSCSCPSFKRISYGYLCGDFVIAVVGKDVV